MLQSIQDFQTLLEEKRRNSQKPLVLPVFDFLSTRETKNKVTNPITKETSARVFFSSVQKQIRVARFDESKNRIVTKVVRGIRSSAQEILWPDYDYNLAKQSSGTKSKRKRAESMNESELDGVSLEGEAKGSEIHDKLCKFLTMDRTAFATRFGQLPEICYSIIYMLQNIETMKKNKTKNLYPIASEVPVCDPTETLGTMIDMVAASADGNVVYLIELKTGKSDFNLRQRVGEDQFLSIRGGSEKEANNKKNPEPLYSNPKNHAKLQIAMAAYLFEHTYSIPIKHIKCVVVKAYSALSLEYHSVGDQFVRDEAYPRLQYMLQQLHQKKIVQQ